MREDIVMGKTKIKLWDFEPDTNSSTLYKVSSRQKVRNILVDCDYFESKGSEDNAKSISFLVQIKLFGKHPSKPIRWYEMYGSTTTPKYNHISRCTKTTEQRLYEGQEEFERLTRILQVVNGEFEDYTTKFISCAKKIIDNKGTITSTPAFIMDAIEEVRDARKSQKVIEFN